VAEQGIQTIEEIKVHYGEQMSRLLNEIAELSSGIKSEEAVIDGRLRAQAGDQVVRDLDAAHRELVARDEIEQRKIRYTELGLEMTAAIQAAGEEANQILTPQQATPEAIIAATTLSEDQIMAAADAAVNMGESGEDACLVLLRAAIERDLEMAQHHIAAFREEWSTALTVLAESSQYPDDISAEEFASRFDSIVPDSAVQLLGGGESELNRLGRIRG
jgi:hypothetical protein